MPSSSLEEAVKGSKDVHAWESPKQSEEADQGAKKQ